MLSEGPRTFICFEFLTLRDLQRLYGIMIQNTTSNIDLNRSCYMRKRGGRRKGRGRKVSKGEDRGTGTGSK